MPRLGPLLGRKQRVLLWRISLGRDGIPSHQRTARPKQNSDYRDGPVAWSGTIRKNAGIRPPRVHDDRRKRTESEDSRVTMTCHQLEEQSSCI
ncbi:Os01g0955050 [Oryza sativa Japonica Group]|uniref:Os01g0955050 protein n=1 Tax=Oryza sativa subsp. japonica TaxID=39947 RepID=A0A0P0VD53_ORYSJ|nr:hypothetical protein EE612_008045 [Oryza sativa]BAS76276.1 Os01g0955050 [Oryza sativa Japonica Group]